LSGRLKQTLGTFFSKSAVLPARLALRKADLIFRVFSDEELVVVYDIRSGDTHLLGEVAYELCGFLSDSPVTADELKRRMLQKFPEDDPDLVAEGIDAALTQLEDADFIFTAAN
jgi:PqqD family protein of HPr-rel-A system